MFMSSQAVLQVFRRDLGLMLLFLSGDDRLGYAGAVDGPGAGGGGCAGRNTGVGIGCFRRVSIMASVIVRASSTMIMIARMRIRWFA